MDERDAIEVVVEAMYEAAEPEDGPLWLAFADPGAGGLGECCGEPTGKTAPPGVWALGVVAGGTARSIADGSVQARTKVCAVVASSGAVASRVAGPDGTVSREPPESGRMLEVMQRYFGLPTAAPEVPAPLIVGVEWLLHIAAAGAHVPAHSLPWRHLATLHPAWGDAAAFAGGDTTVAEALVDVVGGWGWEEVRTRAGDGRLHIEGVSAELARWMDGGMLSRWAVDGLPSLSDTLDAARAVVAPEDWDTVMAVAAGHGSPAAAAPGRRGRRRWG